MLEKSRVLVGGAVQQQTFSLMIQEKQLLRLSFFIKKPFSGDMCVTHMKKIFFVYVGNEGQPQSTHARSPVTFFSISHYILQYTIILLVGLRLRYHGSNYLVAKIWTGCAKPEVALDLCCLHMSFNLKIFFSSSALNEPQDEKTYLLTCALNEYSNQPAHSLSLIRVFVALMKNLCIFSYPKDVQWRFWSDWAIFPGLTCLKVRFRTLRHNETAHFSWISVFILSPNTVMFLKYSVTFVASSGWIVCESFVTETGTFLELK